MTKDQELFRRGYIEAYMGIKSAKECADIKPYEEGRKVGRLETDFGLRNDLHDYAMAAMEPKEIAA